MSLLKVTSPHAAGQNRVASVMRDVLLATVPGVLVLTGYFGPGTLVNECLEGLTDQVWGVIGAGQRVACATELARQRALVGEFV